jgi:outer membrane protein, multidrug efflux system
MKNLYFSILVVPCLFAVAACTVGPNYQRPSTADITPKDWHWKEPPSATRPATAPAPADGAWWKIFADPQLEVLESDALQRNQNLIAAIARVEQSRATARQTRGQFYPQLSGGASWNRSQTVFLNQSMLTSTYSIPFDLSYEVDLWGKIRRNYESANARTQVSEADARQILLTLTSDVALNYFQARTYDAQAVILRRTLELRQETVATLRRKFEADTISEIDLSRSLTDLATAQADLAAVEQARAQVQNALALLCGYAASDFSLSEQALSATVPEIPAGLPSELLERRPDVISAEATLVDRNAEIGVAIAGYFPVVQLTASGGVMSTNAKSFFNLDSGVWSIGPSVSVPIFTGGRTEAEVRRAKAAYDESIAAYKQSVLGAFKDVEDALAQSHFLAQQVQAYLDAQTNARRATDLAQLRYRGGTTSNLEVVDAERIQLQVELLAKSAQGQQLAASVRLIKALGGGWNAAQ